MNYKNISADIRALKNPEKIPIYQNFFKTGKGEYGEGDRFLGLTVPQCRKIAKQYKTLPFSDISNLFQSAYHEERLVAVLILVEQFQKGNEKEKKIICEYYLANTKCINNWDLVDVSAHKIVGAYLIDKDRTILYSLAKSNSLWEKRISIISTFWFINNKEYKDTFAISEILLHDTHDLIHKAVGWMLREVGKRIDQDIEEQFLRKHYKNMPRTMLRYAIERFPEELRQKYLKGKIS